MRSIEQTGKTVEEAIGQALGELGVSRDQATVEVVQEGSRGGLLGIGSAPARVRVSVAGRLGGEAPPAADEAAVAETPAEEGAQGAPAGEGADEAAAEPGEPAAEFGEHAREVTQHILGLMGLDLTAVVTGVDRHQVNLDLEGEDTRIIIGKHGQTLEALQQIVALIANKETPRRYRVFIDAEGYQQRRRERREQELIEMARADAYRAKELGQEAVIQYAVGPYERRVIHMAFVDDPEFVTYSEGEEPHRYVVISPRD